MFSWERVIISSTIVLIMSHTISSLGLRSIDDRQETEKMILSRKLREAGFTDFDLVYMEHMGYGNIVNSKTLKRMKRSSLLQNPITLLVPAFGETFLLELMHVQSVLHPGAILSTRTGDAKEIVWTGSHPDCFLVGSVMSHGGTASASYCSELAGHFNDGVYEYHFETVPEEVIKAYTYLNKTKNILMARAIKTTAQQNVAMTDFFKSMESELHGTDATSGPKGNRITRALPAIEVETAVYTDQLMTAILESYGATTIEGKIEKMLVQWNGVQNEWSKSSQLGYDVKISIKRMVFFTEDPSWYNASTSLGVTLNVFCAGIKNEPAYDHFHMHTGQTKTDVTGMAFTSGACKSNLRCAVSAEKLFLNFFIPAHELGHNLGMYHDVDSGCPSPNDGTMGPRATNWSSCSKKQLKTFLISAGAACLFATNITDSDVPLELRSIVLTGMLPGMIYTPDEMCESTTKKGWRHRSIPWWTICGWRSCIDMNLGSPTFGQMVNYATTPNGKYCDTGKICHQNQCRAWAETGLNVSIFIVIPGGWGNWQEWIACSRTCGRGVQFRQRKCDNPRPSNSPACSGEEYQALFCNNQSCINESSDPSVLIVKRAGELCTGLIASGAFSAANYNGSGIRYHYLDYTVCEVKCLTVGNYTTAYEQRYGLLPDGTPCTTTNFNSSYAETVGAPWSRGMNTACLQGYCRVFGCDNTLNFTQRDRCDVCGGNNSTCDVRNVAVLVNITTGERILMESLPNGTFKIFFYFNYNNMKQNFLEVWSSAGKAIIATNIAGASAISDNRNNPLMFAGTLWTYFFAAQYLFAQGPINDTVNIKLYRKANSSTDPINYGYSLPRPQPASTTATTTLTTPASQTVTDPKIISDTTTTVSSETVTNLQTTSSTVLTATTAVTTPTSSQPVTEPNTSSGTVVTVSYGSITNIQTTNSSMLPATTAVTTPTSSQPVTEPNTSSGTLVTVSYGSLTNTQTTNSSILPATTNVPANSSKPVNDIQTTSSVVQTVSTTSMADSQTTSVPSSTAASQSSSTDVSFSTTRLVNCELMCKNGICTTVSWMPNIQEICGNNYTDQLKAAADPSYSSQWMLMFCIVIATTVVFKS